MEMSKGFTPLPFSFGPPSLLKEGEREGPSVSRGVAEPKDLLFAGSPRFWAGPTRISARAPPGPTPATARRGERIFLDRRWAHD